MSNETVITAAKRRKRKLAFTWLASAVAVTTVAALVMPATTTEYAPACGFEEHIHTEECYATETRLICPLEETAGHIHTEECFLSEPAYLCGLEETPGHAHGEECRNVEKCFVCGLENDPEHVHTEECVGTRYVTVCGLDEDPEHIHDESCYEHVCGLEETEGHTHGESCLDPEPKPACGLVEGPDHVHTADCIEWEETFVCGLDEDPEHVHTEDCIERIPHFVCEVPAGIGHVHNEYCYETVQVLVCGKVEHTHTDECYPKLTGDPHADVEISLDWESTLINTELTGVWADDLVAVAGSQEGYRESELNFITDAYNVKRGYTRYGEWYGNPYEDWNGLFVMFCLHYANIYNVPVDPSPARWITAAADEGLLRDPEELPIPGDIAFCDDDTDGLIDRVGIVREVAQIEGETGPDTEVRLIMGQRQQGVSEEVFTLSAGHIAAYLALPENPEPIPTPAEIPAEQAVTTAENGETVPGEAVPMSAPGDVFLTADTGDGVTAILTAAADSFPYPADELVLTIREVGDAPDEIAMDEIDPYDSAVQAIDSLLAPDGKRAVDARLFDITVWHKEYEDVPPAENEIPELPADPVPAEVPEGTEDPVPAELPEGAEDPLPAELPVVGEEASEAPGFEAKTGVLPEFDSEGSGSAEIIGSMEQNGGPDAEILPVKDVPVSDTPVAEEIPAEKIPEEEIPAEAAEKIERHFTLVEIMPVGPVQVTVEGIETEEDGEYRVYRVNKDGEAAELAPDDFRRGSVTVTTEAF